MSPGIGKVQPILVSWALTAHWYIYTPTGEGPTTHRAWLNSGITATDNTGTLRPHRLLYNGAKPHQPHPIQRTHPHPTSVNPGTTTEHYTNSPGAQEGQTQTASQSRENTQPPITPHPSRYKTRYRLETPY